jgi:hypothetical protein
MPLVRRSRDRPRPPLPKHPYRDTAIVYGVMAVVLVVTAVLLGGDVARTAAVAAAFFVAATAWSWWRFRVRIREEAARAARAAAEADAKEGGQ